MSRTDAQPETQPETQPGTRAATQPTAPGAATTGASPLPPAAPGSGRPAAERRRRPRWVALLAAFLAGALVASGVWFAVGLGDDGGTAPAGDPEATTAPEPRPEGTGTALTWAPPELEDPETVELSAENRSPELEPDQDYVLEMPDEPVDVPGGITVTGGRNVVLIGGEIRISEPGEGHDIRGLYLKNQTGTVHVEGLLISGEALGEGINLDQQLGATVQLQNIRVETVQGTQEGHHADVLQTWAGPEVLRVDHLTGSTTYQGFFLLPRQFGDQPEPQEFDLRNVDLTAAEGAGYLLWRDDLDWPVRLTDVWVEPNGDGEDREEFLWARGDANTDTWDGVEVGTPPDGEFVPEGVAGVGYASPGYAEG